ncbi:MAG: DUF309 domain-containing protein [Thermodesulfobacteriota bacterium]
MQAIVDPSHRLPLAARDALAGLLLADLAAERRSSDGVPAALAVVLRAAGGGVDGTRLDAAVCAALVEAGVLAREGGPARDGAATLVRVAAPWTAAVRHKLESYARVLVCVPRGADLPARLTQARALLEHGLFFEVHEVLEPAWRSAVGEARETLHGLIQAAVAWHHWQGGNAAAASRLAGSARARLAGTPGVWEGFPAGELRRCIAAWEEWLRSARSEEPPPLPFRAARGPRS